MYNTLAIGGMLIILPLIMPTIVVILLLEIGRFLEVGFDHIWKR